MKVIHLITNLGVGGAESLLYQRLLLVKRRGEESNHLILYMQEGIFVEKLKAEGFEVQKVSGFCKGYDFLGIYRFFKIVQQQKPSIIHASLWTATVVARLVGWLMQIPVVCDVHSDPAHHGFIRNSIDWLLPIKNVTFIAVTSAIVPSIKKYMPAATTEVIHNGIDVHKYEHGIQAKGQKIMIMTCGRLVALKQYDRFIEAVKYLVDWGYVHIHAMIVGEGPERERLEALIKKLHLENIVFCVGQQKNMVEWYGQADVLVSCSKTEALSMVILEAMASGVAVLATRSTNAQEVIEHGQNGFLLESSDSLSIAQGLKVLIDDQALRERLGFEAKRTIAQSFTLEDMEKKYRALYHRHARQ